MLKTHFDYRDQVEECSMHFPGRFHHSILAVSREMDLSEHSNRESLRRREKVWAGSLERIWKMGWKVAPYTRQRSSLNLGRGSHLSFKSYYYIIWRHAGVGLSFLFISRLHTISLVLSNEKHNGICHTKFQFLTFLVLPPPLFGGRWQTWTHNVPMSTPFGFI